MSWAQSHHIPMQLSLIRSACGIMPPANGRACPLYIICECLGVMGDKSDAALMPCRWTSASRTRWTCTSTRTWYWYKVVRPAACLSSVDVFTNASAATDRMRCQVVPLMAHDGACLAVQAAHWTLRACWAFCGVTLTFAMSSCSVCTAVLAEARMHMHSGKAWRHARVHHDRHSHADWHSVWCSHKDIRNHVLCCAGGEQQLPSVPCLISCARRPGTSPANLTRSPTKLGYNYLPAGLPLQAACWDAGMVPPKSVSVVMGAWCRIIMKWQLKSKEVVEKCDPALALLLVMTPCYHPRCAELRAGAGQRGGLLAESALARHSW